LNPNTGLFDYVGGDSGGAGYRVTMPAAPLPQSPVMAGGIVPASGATAGGELVTISGANFRAGVQVFIGGVPASSVTVVNRTTLTALTPAGAAGAVDVMLFRDNQASTLPGGFTFNAPPPPPPPPGPPPPPPPPSNPCSGDLLVCDNLQGSTSGQRFGGSFDSFGWVATAHGSAIRWKIPTTTSGFFEAEVTGLRTQGYDDNLKQKILTMSDGGFQSANSFRATVEKRTGAKDNEVRYRFIAGNEEHGHFVDSCCTGPIGWNPNEVYKWRMEWGNGHTTIRVTTSSGSTVYAFGGDYDGVYNPGNHLAEIGLVGGNGGSDAHCAYIGARYRNVRIGRR
jgi:hypothetical protein